MVQICCCLVLRVRLQKRSGGQSEEAPPVPIPNTEVKLLSVDNTWRATAREDRTLPERGLRTRRKLRPWICIYRGKLGYNRRGKEAHNSIYSSIAQSVEHAAVNRRVVGSSPTWGANQDTVWFYHTVSWFIKTKGLEPEIAQAPRAREKRSAIGQAKHAASANARLAAQLEVTKEHVIWRVLSFFNIQISEKLRVLHRNSPPLPTLGDGGELSYKF